MNKITSFLALSFASVTLLASCGGGDASSSGRGTGLADALAFARENSFGITGTAYTAFDTLTSEKEERNSLVMNFITFSAKASSLVKLFIITISATAILLTIRCPPPILRKKTV